MVVEECNELFGHHDQSQNLFWRPWLLLPTMAGFVASGPLYAEDNNSFTSNHSVHPSPDTLTSMFTTKTSSAADALF